MNPGVDNHFNYGYDPLMFENQKILLFNAFIYFYFQILQKNSTYLK